MGISFYTPPPLPRDEAQRQAAVIASGLGQADRALKMHEVVASAADRFNVPIAAATLIHRDRQQILSTIGLSGNDTSRAASFCGHAILHPGKVMCVPDALEDSRFAGNPAVLEDPHLRFYAGAPLVTSDGYALGTLCVIDRQPRPVLTPREEEDLQRLADRIMATSAMLRRAG